MAKIKVDKLEAARRQVDTAIRMLFSHEDPVAIHTLAMAAFGLLKDLANKKERNVTQDMEEWIREDKKKDFWGLIRRGSNFLKHADKDPDGILEDVKEEVNDFILLLTCIYYEDSAHRRTPEMTTLLTWCIVQYPDIWKEDSLLPFPKELLIEARKDIGKESRWDKLEIGRNLLSEARKLESADTSSPP